MFNEFVATHHFFFFLNHSSLHDSVCLLHVYKQCLISFRVFVLCLSLIAESHVSETCFRIELQGKRICILAVK